MATNPDELLTLLETYYQRHGRDLPWRPPSLKLAEDKSLDPYAILVSEIMLQQTQVARVIPKYQAFLDRFKTMQSLAEAPLADVLKLWVGLGYNRRAKYLHQAARQLMNKEMHKIGPYTYEELVACPGIGANTAAAVLAYAYDQPVLFVETNVRTVIIHLFFHGQSNISDKDILAKLARVVPWENDFKMSARVFYWSLMDYGTFLKARVGNLNHRSKAYGRQSTFGGSSRQIRGRIIRELAAGPQPLKVLRHRVNDQRFEVILRDLAREQLISLHGKVVMLYNEGIERYSNVTL